MVLVTVMERIPKEIEKTMPHTIGGGGEKGEKVKSVE